MGAVFTLKFQQMGKTQRAVAEANLAVRSNEDVQFVLNAGNT